ncbi:MAG: tetratricopeptide repeat protein [Planctomycetota bacterium]
MPDEAATVYAAVAAAHPDTEVGAIARLGEGRALAALGRIDAARVAFGEVTVNVADPELGRDAAVDLLRLDLQADGAAAVMDAVTGHPERYGRGLLEFWEETAATLKTVQPEAYVRNRAMYPDLFPDDPRGGAEALLDAADFLRMAGRAAEAEALEARVRETWGTDPGIMERLLHGAK